jgi:predicted nucleotidyltransferase/PHD/YefM family antitoxin component YafN of YafNO toxin-antitoxin module
VEDKVCTYKSEYNVSPTAMIGVRELAKHASRVISDVLKTGRPVIVTRHGRPAVAMLRVDEGGLEDILSEQARRLVAGARKPSDAPEHLRGLLRDLRLGLEEVYGDVLEGLYLFGSHARGKGDSDSDVDVLVVLDRVSEYGQEIGRTSELISELSLRWGRPVSRVFVSSADWSAGETPFLSEVRADAIRA